MDPANHLQLAPDTDQLVLPWTHVEPQLPFSLTITNGCCSAIADIGESWVLRQQWGGLLTVAASSSRTAASCISELTLPTLNRASSQDHLDARFRRTTAAL